jgi:hypothetical protein
MDGAPAASKRFIRYSGEVCKKTIIRNGNAFYVWVSNGTGSQYRCLYFYHLALRKKLAQMPKQRCPPHQSIYITAGLPSSH